ncbi:hypothetical protein M917_2359 [Psychrobacter aquaticus CMS 56]|uniref:Uncharacterized protein n=1 Tax=Psychrobacter aquaticus CMS 56 TaxID=1354303 RepID=U4T959_9GAMM|nr:hypothetical protein M917_2359 [Psychrobacter aquaticus CMS 56]
MLNEAFDAEQRVSNAFFFLDYFLSLSTDSSFKINILAIDTISLTLSPSLTLIIFINRSNKPD